MYFETKYAQILKDKDGWASEIFVTYTFSSYSLIVYFLIYLPKYTPLRFNPFNFLCEYILKQSTQILKDKDGWASEIFVTSTFYCLITLIVLFNWLIFAKI